MSHYISRLPDPDRAAFPRRLVLLGSTGSIGTSALKVVSGQPERFQVLALAGGRNAALLAEQAKAFRPPWLAVLDAVTAEELRGLLPPGYDPEILVGSEAYVILAGLPEADLVLSAIVGAAGLPPTWAAVNAGKTVALANKESLVLAGHLIRAACAASGAIILPVDSEHNALFQAMVGENPRHVRRLVLTASGGPFRGKDREFLKTVSRAQALNHPNWSMGAKITIDSATLMNKGLEVIEACHLYGVDVDAVATVVHPQSIIHSLVEYADGSLLAHLGPPDMMIAIAYCLAYPERVALPLAPLDLAAIGRLTFEEPDLAAFPCLRLAREAYAAGPSHPTVLNAANEVAVELFLKERIPFLRIPEIIENALASHAGRPVNTIEDILDLDAEVRLQARAAAGAAAPGS